WEGAAGLAASPPGDEPVLLRVRQGRRSASRAVDRAGSRRYHDVKTAPSPSGKAADCKSATPGSNPGGASSLGVRPQAVFCSRRPLEGGTPPPIRLAIIPS